jgi:dTMP kinase
MPNHRQQGLLVSFEGVDGSGKSTQLTAVADQLRLIAPELKITIAREPGGTNISEVIRQVIRKPYLQERLRQWFAHGSVDPTPMAPETELFLFEAARAQLVQEVLIPALDAGHVVLLDRYVDSSIAYQGYGRGVDLAGIEAANLVATRGRLPDLTYLFDVPADVGLARKVGTEVGVDYMGSQALAFYERVRKGYLHIAATNPSRVRVVDGQAAPNDITGRVVTDLLNMRTLLRPFEVAQRQFRLG